MFSKGFFTRGLHVSGLCGNEIKIIVLNNIECDRDRTAVALRSNPFLRCFQYVESRLDTFNNLVEALPCLFLCSHDLIIQVFLWSSLSSYLFSFAYFVCFIMVSEIRLHHSFWKFVLVF